MTSTFDNELRLNEQATGDNSGSWGTVTNTNLTLIGEALGYGTEGITTNANTHTSTIADGATDPVRALYVEYTGTLDSACTITIAPNTVNKVCFIENGTSGSQNIIIKQGSGATITIPAGQTKAVYLDGAGSGAKVVDAFASLSVVDLIVSDDLVVADDASVGGILGVTGVLTTTAATVFNGGFASNQESTIIAADGAADNAFALIVKNQEATDGRSQGVRIDAGSNASDAALVINDHDASTSLFRVKGSGVVEFVDGTASLPSITNFGDLNTGIFFPAADTIAFTEGGAEAARFDNTGRLLIGHTSSVPVSETHMALQTIGTNFATSGVTQSRFEASASGPSLLFAHSRGSVGAHAILQDGDEFGKIRFNGSDGNDFANYGAHIVAAVDGTPGANDMPGRIIFGTTADGAQAPTERMRISNTGNVGIGTTAINARLDIDGAGGSPATSGTTQNGVFRIRNANNNNCLDMGQIAGSPFGSWIQATDISDLSQKNPLYLNLNGGKVLIGTTTEGQNQADNFTVSDSGNMGMTLRSTDSGECSIFFSDGTSGSPEFAGSLQYIHSDNSMRFATNAGERMRIAAAGDVFFNCTSQGNTHAYFDAASNSRMVLHIGSSSTSGTTIAAFRNPNGAVGTISTSGSATAYNTSSDYRLKENVVYDWDATTRLKKLKPARFNFIADADKTVDGFLAHEAQAVVPECVTGTKDAMRDEEYEVTAAVEEVTDDDGNVTTEAADAVMGTRSVPDMQGIDQSKIVPLLVKTILELEARITALEA